ncbi:MAG: hypothetical protein F6K47_23460 [Symploca sp. SIO2E6]|nr:hypothetical protein [Symploca sp. SIO2E6]
MKLSEFNFLNYGLATIVAMIILTIGFGVARGEPEVPQNLTATFEQPAFILVDVPRNLTLSGAAAIELTVLPRIVDETTPYLVEVYLTKDTQWREDLLSDKTLLGTYGFFPPAQEGKRRKFVVAAPANLAELVATGEDTISLVVQIVPVNPRTTLNHSSLTVLEVTVVE